MLDKNKVEKFIKAAMVYEGDLYSQKGEWIRGTVIAHLSHIRL